ncbi:MAG TPA: hypothetical protein PK156_14065 [Polyangium sp.]|nr:hypothetical protein [Polyangium sp.]
MPEEDEEDEEEAAEEEDEAAELLEFEDELEDATSPPAPSDVFAGALAAHAPARTRLPRASGIRNVNTFMKSLAKRYKSMTAAGFVGS